jgi:Contact-dependent growth inhibition CdiA C-terminal domain
VTLTLEPEMAGLLARTGHAWPDADEDRLAAMAAGWGGLATQLEAVRADHAGAARTILAHNSGAGVMAFGGWASDLDGWLLQLVEGCARAEAWLLSISRWVYETKRAIIGALDDLARAIDQAERDLANVPIVGGTLASLLEGTVGALVDGARNLIGGILGALADPVIGQAVPGMIGVVATVKAVVQGLRKLLHAEAGADWPTTPSRTPLPTNTPRGPRAEPNPKDDEDTTLGLQHENEAAVTLAQAGYDIEQIPRRQGVSTADYLIGGKRFDCYSPTGPRVRNAWSVVEEKILKDQTDRVVINLDTPDAQVILDDVRRQFQDYPLPGLVEVKAIAPGGAIIDIYP